MLESGDSFATFVRRYRLERSEGLVLRYLTDAWRALDRSLPDDVYTDALEDVVEWLGELIRATDATLLDEWTLLAGRPVHDHLAPDAPTAARPFPPPAWRTAVRTAAFGWVDLLAARCVRRARRAQRVDRGRRCARRWRRTGTSTTPSLTDADARSAAWFDLAEEPDALGRHPAPRRPGRRRRVALRRHRRPRGGPRRRGADVAPRAARPLRATSKPSTTGAPGST